MWTNRTGMVCGYVCVDGPMTQFKVKALYKEVARKTSVTDPSEFKTSRGCSFNFINCHGLRKIKVSGETASSDISAVQVFPSGLQGIIQEGGYTADQIFNADKTGMQKRQLLNSRKQSGTIRLLRIVPPSF